MWFYAMIVILLIVLIWVTRLRESFVGDVNLSTLPNPHELMRKARELLDKYDKPEVWNHAAQVIDKDPGELARMNLGITQ